MADGEEVSVSVFGALPEDVKRKIFSFLRFPDNIQARQVCTAWCDLVDENVLFSVELSDETLETVQCMGRPIKNLAVSHLTKVISFSESIRGNIGTKVSHLSLGQAKRSKCILSQENIVALLTSLKEVQSLEIDPRQLGIKDLSIFKMILLPNVRKLTICVRRLNELDIFMNLLKIGLPMLETLHLNFYKVHMNSVERMLPLYLEIYEFIAAHKMTLRSLNLILPFHWIDRLKDPSKKFENLHATRRNQIMEGLRGVQLVDVNLQGLPVEGSQMFNLGMYLLKEQKRLERLYVQDLKVGYYPQLSPAFENCASKLTDVRIEGASMGSHSHGPFSCAFLQPCMSLRTLIINNSQITELTEIQKLPISLQVLSLKMPIDGTVVYSWVSKNLVNLKELSIRPTLWDSNALVNINHFQNFLGLPHLTKLTLSEGLFESKEIFGFTETTPGLTLAKALYCWPDLVNVTIKIDRTLYQHVYY